MRNKDILPPLDKWEYLGDECIGTGEPSYKFERDVEDLHAVYTIKRKAASLKWKPRIVVDGHVTYRGGLSCGFDTPEEAYQAMRKRCGLA